MMALPRPHPKVVRVDPRTTLNSSAPKLAHWNITFHFHIHSHSISQRSKITSFQMC